MSKSIAQANFSVAIHSLVSGGYFNKLNEFEKRFAKNSMKFTSDEMFSQLTLAQYDVIISIYEKYSKT